MNKERLFEIGNEVASLWGGSCYNFKVNRKEKEVVFDCIEHGEKFSPLCLFPKSRNNLEWIYPSNNEIKKDRRLYFGSQNQ